MPLIAWIVLLATSAVAKRAAKKAPSKSVMQASALQNTSVAGANQGMHATYEFKYYVEEANDYHLMTEFKTKPTLYSGYCEASPFAPKGGGSADLKHHEMAKRHGFYIVNTATKENVNFQREQDDLSLDNAEQVLKKQAFPDLPLKMSEKICPKEKLEDGFLFPYGTVELNKLKAVLKKLGQCSGGCPEAQNRKKSLRNLFQVDDADVVFASGPLQKVGGVVAAMTGTGVALKFWQMFNHLPGKKAFFYLDGSTHPKKWHTTNPDEVEAYPENRWYTVSQDPNAVNMLEQLQDEGKLTGYLNKHKLRKYAGIGATGITATAMQQIEQLYQVD